MNCQSIKILCVIDSLTSGGAQRQLVSLALGLKSRGHTVEFYLYYPYDYYKNILESADIPITYCFKPSRFSFKPIITLRKILKYNKYDIVISFLDTPNLYSEVSCVGIKQTKLIVSERSTYNRAGLPLYFHVMQWLHRLADAITVNSRNQREQMVRLYPWMDSKIETIYNGVDLSVFHPKELYTDKCSDILSIVAIGTIVKNKNMLNLAKALVLCRDLHGVKFNLTWVGKCEDSENGKRSFIEANSYLAQVGLLEQWQWLGERSDVADILRSHDVLIHPSFYEGFPNVVCEAFSCGLPVLASKVCDHPYLVADGVRGFLFDPSSPESIAESIFKFYTLPLSVRNDMSVAANEFARSSLSVDRMVSSYERLMCLLLNRNSI